MMSLHNFLLLSVLFVASALAYSGEFVPKSYYVIDQNGHKSDIVYFRSKRDVELFPLLRIKRGGSGSSASSQAHSSASASSSSKSGSGGSSGGGGGGGGPPFFQGGNDYFPGIIDPGFSPNFFNFGDLGNTGGGGGGAGGGSGAHSHSFASSSSSSSSGIPRHGGVGAHGGYDGPVLFSRFGEDTGTGVKVSGSAQGPKGAFSSSSSSIDSDGKITYSVKSGKY